MFLKCVTLVFYFNIVQIYGITSTEITGFTSRQSKAISFFPIDDENNNNNHLVQQYIKQSQNYPVDGDRTDQIFHFSNDQRNDNLNQNEIQQDSIQIYNQKPNDILPAYNVAQQKMRQNQVRQNPYAGQYTNYQNFNRPFQPGLQSQYQHNPYQQTRPFPRPQNPYYSPNIYNQQNPYQIQNPQNYAGQFGNYRPPGGQYDNYFNNYQFQNGGPQGLLGNPNANPQNLVGQFGNFLNNFQSQNGGPQPQGQFGNVGGQFTKALEDISRFDDYQCVPKLLCQMIGNPRGQNNLPSFLNAPTLTALIAAVPSTSPILVFGRAALLGISGGERGCDGSYPKCPRQEDDLLYYLNNHRGGFFRFFNGGQTFGEEQYQQEENDNYNQNYQGNYQNQYQQQQQQLQQQQQQGGITSVAGLQSLADTINQSGGVNLSNLGSNLGLLSNLAQFVGTMNGGAGGSPVKTPSNGNGGGISEIVGNLLTGLVGNRFSGRKISKRSVQNVFTKEQKKLFSISGGINPKKKGASRKRNLSVDLVNPYEKIKKIKEVEKNPIDYNLLRLIYLSQNDVDINNNIQPVEPEGRIMNSKQQIQSLIGSSQINFPSEQLYESNRNIKQYNNIPPNTILVFNLSPDTQIKFPTIDENRTSKTIRFVDKIQDNEPAPTENYESTRMIFPDRTGTGNLRFDNDVFNNVQENRYGKILTGGVVQQTENTGIQGNFNYPIYPIVGSPSYSKYPSSVSQSHSNRYQTQNNQYTHSYRPQIYTNNYQSQSQKEDTSQNIYVTNSKGVIEYYINKRGEKIYT